MRELVSGCQMTVTKLAAHAASTLFDRFRTVGPPPAPTPHPPLAARGELRAAAAGATLPSPSGKLAAGPQRRGPVSQRRLRAERRRADRRTLDQGSPYGTERRSGADDRQGDRRAGPSECPAGIGLTRDYFAQTDTRPAEPPGSGIPAHLIIRFNA